MNVTFYSHYPSQHIHFHSLSCHTTSIKSPYVFGILFTDLAAALCDGSANFPFVNGRCHLKRSLPFETVDAIYNGRLHTSLQRKLKETNKEKIFKKIMTKKEKNNNYKREKTGEKKSPKISRLELIHTYIHT